MSKRIIQGYAAVFGSVYNMGNHDEMIDQNALSRADFSECRLLRDHNSSLILDRYKFGTLEIKADTKGLFFRAVLPETELGEETATLLSTGVLRETSWGWTGTLDRWETRNGRQLRIITAVNKIWDISVVSFPANPATRVSLEAPMFTTTSTGRNVTFTPSTKAVYDPYEETFLFQKMIMEATPQACTDYRNYTNLFSSTKN